MRSLRILVTAAALVSALLLPASPAISDDFMGGVRFGYYTDASEPFVGGELLVRMAPRFYFNPNVEVVLVGDGSYLTYNGDFHYDFPARSSFFWLGAGVAVVQRNPEGPDNTSTDAGVNLLGGVGFRTGRVIPYFQAKVILTGNSEFVISAGLRF